MNFREKGLLNEIMYDTVEYRYVWFDRSCTTKALHTNLLINHRSCVEKPKNNSIKSHFCILVSFLENEKNVTGNFATFWSN